MSSLTAAFKCHTKDEVYFFMGGEYVKETYDSTGKGNADDKEVDSPAANGDFEHLGKKRLFKRRIDCAFSFGKSNQAYIFSGDQCGIWTYPSDNTTTDIDMEDPFTIASKFPCLQDSEFEHSVDAAFELSSTHHLAYLFKDNNYVLIDYSASKVIHKGSILDFCQGFKGLADNFDDGNFDAALTYHVNTAESDNVDVYFFKGDNCVRVNVALDTKTTAYKAQIVGGVEKIDKVWNGLYKVLPRRS